MGPKFNLFSVTFKTSKFRYLVWEKDSTSALFSVCEAKEMDASQVEKVVEVHPIEGEILAVTLKL